MTSLNGTATAELADTGPKLRQPARTGLCGETGKAGSLTFFVENSGKSLGLHILLLLSIITYMKKHATSSENDMTLVCPECIWIVKFSAFTPSDFLNMSGKQLTENLSKNY